MLTTCLKSKIGSNTQYDTQNANAIKRATLRVVSLYGYQRHVIYGMYFPTVISKCLNLVIIVSNTCTMYPEVVSCLQSCLPITSLTNTIERYIPLRASLMAMNCVNLVSLLFNFIGNT